MTAKSRLVLKLAPRSLEDVPNDFFFFQKRKEHKL